MSNISKIIMVNGPVVKADKMEHCQMREMVTVGEKKLIGEIISINEGIGTIQVYEETEGLRVGETVERTYKSLSLKLGPGIMGNIFDGIQRPLNKINEISKDFIKEGIGLLSIDQQKKWDVKVTVTVGDYLSQGEVYGIIEETSLVTHKLMVPPNVSGEVSEIKADGNYTVEDTIVKIETENKKTYELKLYQEWPVRKNRPIK